MPDDISLKIGAKDTGAAALLTKIRELETSLGSVDSR